MAQDWAKEKAEWCGRHGGAWDRDRETCEFPGELHPKGFRVFYQESTPRGFDDTDIKFLDTRPNADRYAQALLEYLKEGEESEAVRIEDLETGVIKQSWFNAGEGKIEEM